MTVRRWDVLWHEADMLHYCCTTRSPLPSYTKRVHKTSKTAELHSTVIEVLFTFRTWEMLELSLIPLFHWALHLISAVTLRIEKVLHPLYSEVDDRLSSSDPMSDSPLEGATASQHPKRLSTGNLSLSASLLPLVFSPLDGSSHSMVMTLASHTEISYCNYTFAAVMSHIVMQLKHRFRDFRRSAASIRSRTEENEVLGIL